MTYKIKLLPVDSPPLTRRRLQQWPRDAVFLSLSGHRCGVRACAPAVRNPLAGSACLRIATAALLAGGVIVAERYVTDIFPLEWIQEAFEKQSFSSEPFLKSIIRIS